MTSHYALRIRIDLPDDDALQAFMKAAHEYGEVTKVKFEKVVEYVYVKDAE